MRVGCHKPNLRGVKTQGFLCVLDRFRGGPVSPVSLPGLVRVTVSDGSYQKGCPSVSTLLLHTDLYDCRWSSLRRTLSTGFASLRPSSFLSFHRPPPPHFCLWTTDSGPRSDETQKSPHWLCERKLRIRSFSTRGHRTLLSEYLSGRDHGPEMR